jgi:organic hydroperoxide reductase OsmC/OhrA
MLLHALHNGLIVLLLYFEPELTARGIGIEEQKHLPEAWIAMGAGAVCFGIAALYVLTRRGTEPEETTATTLG